jgi:succinoglycan biosynthesis protein ExoA
MVMSTVANIEPEKIVVILPTLNEEAHIENVITALLRNDPFAQRCSVVVADGGSTDKTAQIVTQLMHKYPNLSLAHNAGRTQAAAMNMLLEPAYDAFEVIVRCDVHAAYPSGFVSGVTECIFLHGAASIVIPMDAIANTNGCFQRGLVWIADTKLGAGGAAHRGGASSGYCHHGHHAAFRMSDFRRLGGYDTHFVANEDAEYDHRLIQSGKHIWMTAENRIGYFPRTSLKRLWKQYYNYGKGRAQTCLKHRIRPSPRALIPAVHTVLLILSVIAMPFSALFLIWPIIYMVVVLVAGIWTSLHHRSLCGMAASAALAAMHLAWGLGFLGRIAAGSFNANGKR